MSEQIDSDTEVDSGNCSECGSNDWIESRLKDRHKYPELNRINLKLLTCSNCGLRLASIAVEEGSIDEGMHAFDILLDVASKKRIEE